MKPKIRESRSPRGAKVMRRDTTEPQPELGADHFANAVMTLRESADFLKFHFMTLYKLIKTAGLPAFRMGSDWRVRRPDLDKWIAGQYAGGRKQAA